MLADALSGMEILFYLEVSLVNCLFGTCSEEKSVREYRAMRVSGYTADFTFLPKTLNSNCFSHQEAYSSQAENTPFPSTLSVFPSSTLVGQVESFGTEIFVDKTLDSKKEVFILTSTWRIKNHSKSWNRCFKNTGMKF